MSEALQKLSVEMRGRLAFQQARWPVPNTLCLTLLVLRDLYDPAELDLGNKVQQLQWPLSPLQFYRNFVSKNKPCLLTGEALEVTFHCHAVAAAY